MPKFDALSEAITKKIEEAQKNNTLFSGAFKNQDVIRRKTDKKDNSTVWRPAFVRDIDKILYSPFSGILRLLVLVSQPERSLIRSECSLSGDMPDFDSGVSYRASDTPQSCWDCCSTDASSCVSARRADNPQYRTPHL